MKAHAGAIVGADRSRRMNSGKLPFQNIGLCTWLAAKESRYHLPMPGMRAAE
jgi:hypothetical protein